MILLPNGCNCSEPAVTPKNWKTTNSTKKNWRIHYYFRDPKFKEKYPYGKMITIKGMNRFKDIEQRQEATQLLIDEELYMLKVEGFNPITKEFNGQDVEVNGNIEPETPFIKAIEIAYNNLQLPKKTKDDIGIVKRKFVRSTILLGFDNLRIKDVMRKHVRNVLEHQATTNNYSNNRYNKTRAYMQMVFKELLLSDAIEYNPIDSIPKKKHIVKLRETLTNDEIKKIKAYLKKNTYTFYRYMEIFFHSGSRSTELMGIKKEDVDLKKGIFKVTVKKGYTQEYRAINKNVEHFWKELVEKASKGDYIFSEGLEPSPKRISERQITIRWKRHVKDKLGIDKDFYSLKHLHTTKVIDLYSMNLASNINGHKSTRMNERHYDTMHKERLLEQAKKIDVSL